MTLTIRAVKESALTHDELDANFAEVYSAAGHGFAVGDLVYRSGASTWAKATNAAGTSVADGVVVAVPDANTAWIATQAGTLFTKTSHGLGSAGTVVYLSTGGGMTASAPLLIRQRVGKVMDTNTILFHPQFPHEEF